MRLEENNKSRYLYYTDNVFLGHQQAGMPFRISNIGKRINSVWLFITNIPRAKFFNKKSMKSSIRILFSITLLISVAFISGFGGEGDSIPSFEFPANSVGIHAAYDVGNRGNRDDLRVDYELSTLGLLEKTEEVTFDFKKA